MALTVQFWTYAKQENSTAIPSATPAATFSAVLLKEDCSVVNPALQLNVPLTTNLYDYNYCRIQEFNRYYFVSDWVWSDGLWTAELEVDVLGSWRTQIGTQSLYVLRAASDYDGTIVDNTYPVTTEAPTYISTAVNNPFAETDPYSMTGSFIVGIVTQRSDNGSVSYYAMTRAQFQEFCTKLFTYSTGWLDVDVTEISENLQKALVNPFQYVVSCVYLPIPVSDLPGATSRATIYFGWWFLNLTSAAKVVYSTHRVSKTVSLTIPRHPQAASRGNYLNIAPYSFYTLRSYPFGTVDIDSEAIAGYNTLDLYYDVDVVTGHGELNIAVNGKNNPIRSISAQIGVSVPTASIAVDYMNLGKTSVVAGASQAISEIGGGNGGFFENITEKAKSFIGNVRTGNWSAIGAGAKQSISKIASAALAAKATVEVMGQQGCGSLYNVQTLALSGRFLPLVSEDLSHRGRPLCQLRRINMLSGFLMCADADVIIPCTEREKQAIQAYLQSGLYYY